MREADIRKQIVLEENYFYFTNKRKLTLSVMKNLDFRDVLEIGPGSGVLSREIIKARKAKGKKTEIDCVEIDKKLYGILKKEKRFRNVYNDDFEKISIKGKYDLILLLDVFEHFRKDKQALKKLNNLNRKDGYLILAVPAYPFLFSYHDKIVMHFRRYSFKPLRRMLVKNNYEVIKATYFNSFLFPTLFLMRKIFNTKSQESDTGKAGFFNGILKILGSIEVFLISCGIRIPFGTSILMICRKKK